MSTTVAPAVAMMPASSAEKIMSSGLGGGACGSPERASPIWTGVPAGAGERVGGGSVGGGPGEARGGAGGGEEGRSRGENDRRRDTVGGPPQLVAAEKPPRQAPRRAARSAGRISHGHHLVPLGVAFSPVSQASHLMRATG